MRALPALGLLLVLFMPEPSYAFGRANPVRWVKKLNPVSWFRDKPNPIPTPTPTPTPTPEPTPTPTPGADPFDWNNVTFQSSLNVRDWKVTSKITSIEFRPDRFHIDHTRRGTWPSVDIGGGTLQEATVWVFFNIGGRWYGTGGERLRPNQTDKQLTNPSHIGPGWLYDPNRWGPMTNYVPQPGELVGFMVTQGSLRSDSTYVVQERTSVVLIPFPNDDVITGFPPFFWEER